MRLFDNRGRVPYNPSQRWHGTDGLGDEAIMRQALAEAKTAADRGEVPVGAVLVCDGAVVAKASNRREGHTDPTAHAEMLALRDGAASLSRWRLGGTLYVTLEPCAMCAGALVLARINRLVFGATDPKAGACGSCIDVIRAPYVNHRIEVVGGLLAEASAALLRDFFRQRRLLKAT